MPSVGNLHRNITWPPPPLPFPERLLSASPFEILEGPRSIETIASGRSIRELPRLIRYYGKGRWRKRKGIARVSLNDGTVREAEIHWYEASGIGRREYKIKRYLGLS